MVELPLLQVLLSICIRFRCIAQWLDSQVVEFLGLREGREMSDCERWVLLSQACRHIHCVSSLMLRNKLSQTKKPFRDSGAAWLVALAPSL